MVEELVFTIFFGYFFPFFFTSSIAMIWLEPRPTDKSPGGQTLEFAGTCWRATMRPRIKRDATHNTKTPKKKNYEKVQAFGSWNRSEPHAVWAPCLSACVAPANAALSCATATCMVHITL